MTMTQRRDRHDIIAEILETARGGKLKTHIMCEAKLSYHQIQNYLTLLTQHGFLKNTTIKQQRQTLTMFKTTRKGIRLLKQIEYLNRL